MNESDLDKFYNPTVESARTSNAELKLKKLNGQSPIGKWLRGRKDGIYVNGFVLKIIGYGIVNVHWVKNKHLFEGKGTTIGLHGDGYDFYSPENELQRRDIEDLIDLTLKLKDFKWTEELVNIK